jgi:hypothetical protein
MLVLFGLTLSIHLIDKGAACKKKDYYCGLNNLANVDFHTPNYLTHGEISFLH